MADAAGGIETLAGGSIFHELDADHEALLTDIADVGESFERLEELGELFGFLLDCFQEFVFLEKVERGEGGGAGEGIAGVGVAVEEGFIFGRRAEEGVEYFLSGERGREGEIAAGNAFGDAHEVRLNGFVFNGEHFAGSAEAGGDFIADQERVVLGGETADFAEEAGGMDDHAGGALDDGFNSYCRNFLMMSLEEFFELG